eukprot:4848981-Pyramimonas_sp.AAC.1
MGNACGCISADQRTSNSESPDKKPNRRKPPLPGAQAKLDAQSSQGRKQRDALKNQEPSASAAERSRLDSTHSNPISEADTNTSSNLRSASQTGDIGVRWGVFRLCYGDVSHSVCVRVGVVLAPIESGSLA